jgi:uncharacterized repeat protein (TIGR01451 family)
MKRPVSSILFFCFCILFLMAGKSGAYTDITLYASYAGKIDFTATGRSLKTSDTTVGTSAGNTLSLPAGTTVKAAYLYWAGSWNSQNAGSSPDYSITFAYSGSPALSITGADREFTEDFARFNGASDSNEDYFGGFKDVTAYVRQNGAGTYTVSDLTVWTGTPHSSYSTIVAGWSLIVIYEYPAASAEPLRVVNVYDGFKLYYSAAASDEIDLTPSNFKIPASNIRGKHGYLSWEGDVGNSNSYENLYFNNHVITSAANTQNNPYNSTLTFPSGDPNSGLSSTAGNDARSLGLDLDFFDISAYLNAGDTSVATRYQTGTDMVILNAEVLSVTNTDVSDLSISGTGNGPFVAGSNGSYTLKVANNGPSAADTIQVTGTLPMGLTYLNTVSGNWSAAVTDDGGGTTVVWTYTGSTPVEAGTVLQDLVFNVSVESSSVGSDGRIPASFSVSSPNFDNHSDDDTVVTSTDASALRVQISSSARGLAKAGDRISYTATVTNVGSVAQTGVTMNGGAMGGGSYAMYPFRVTEYPVAAGQFTGTAYELTLNQDLASNYFVMVQGSDGNGTASLGPNTCYIALTSDPTGRGDLDVSSGSNKLGFTRGGASSSWVGVITVVECIGDESVNGFKLLGAKRVVHTGTSTSGTATFTEGWSSLGRIMLMGGYNGAGCNTSQGSAANTKVCHARIYPQGTGTIAWTRNAGGATLSEAVSTVMVVEWGTAWTVQRVNVTGNNGDDGAVTTSAYNTANLTTSVSRDHTFVWGTGHTNDNGVGDASEGVLITLGNGVARNSVESQVAVGIEYNNNAVDFDVYAVSHPLLHVDYRFLPDGNTNSMTVSVAVNSAGVQRMAMASNGCGLTTTTYPRPMFSAYYQSGSSVLLSRQRSGASFPAWIQGIDFSDIVDTSAPTVLARGESLSLSYTYTIPVTTPDESVATQSVFVYSDQIPSSIGASASVSDYVPGYMSSNSTRFDYEDNLFRRDLDGSGLNDTIYTGGYGFAPLTVYATGYYDAAGNLVYSGTAYSDGSGFFVSSYDNSSDSAACGTWTAVVMPSSFTPRSTLSAQMSAVPTGVVDVFTVSLSGKVEFTDPAGNPVDGYDMSLGQTAVYVRVTYSTANTSAGIVNTLSVSVVDNVSGDSETIVLTETGPNTGIFANYAGGLSISSTTGAGVNNGVLLVAGETSIRVDYYDPSGSLYSDEVYIPLLALITSFKAVEENGKVVVQWETGSEMGTLGFYLKRKDSPKGKYRNVHDGLLPGLLVSPQGGSYRLVDPDAEPGKTYTYKLVEVEVKGRHRDYGPYKVSTTSGTAVSSSSVTSVKKTVKSSFPTSRPAFSFTRKARVKSRASAVKALAKWNTAKLKRDLKTFSKVFASPTKGQMKIRTTEEGLCYVPVQDIASSMGYSENNVENLIASGRLALTRLGYSVAYMKDTDNKGIYFYSEAPNSNYTDEAVYMLRTGTGKIMEKTTTGGGTPAGSDAAGFTFTETVHVEDDLYPLTSYYTDPYEDYWVGEYVMAGDASLGSLEVDVAAPGLVQNNTDATLKLTLKGGSMTAAYPDHHVKVSVNGVAVGEDEFDGTRKATLSFTFPSSLLDSANTVTVTGIKNNGVPYSVFFFDSLDLSYPRSYTAVDGVLSAAGHGRDVIRVSGFANGDLRVFDISDRKKPVAITDAFKEQIGRASCRERVS